MCVMYVCIFAVVCVLASWRDPDEMGTERIKECSPPPGHLYIKYFQFLQGSMNTSQCEYFVVVVVEMSQNII